jgi:predicted MFS family arabinose efflux permease
MIQVGSQETPGEVRISTLIGISVLVAAIALWPPHRRVRVEKPEALHARSNVPWQARLWGLVTRGVHLQTSDLMLVIGFNFLLTVQPILLRREFDLEPGIVGLAAGGVALAKVTGGFLGNRLAARFGATAALPTLIVISGVAIVLSPLTSHPGIYVALSLTAIVLGLGQWAIVVSSAVDRMDADHRPALIGSWNLREFGVIAVASTTSGWMLDAVGPRTVLVLGGVNTIGAGLTVRQLLTIPRTDQHPELVHPN